VLLDAGAWVDAEDINGKTPLAICVDNREFPHVVDSLKTATLLLKAGADVNHPLKSGRSILDMVADDYSHRKLARLLKDAGAKQTPVVIGTQ
jgi:ankyrin repeat protein